MKIQTRLLHSYDVIKTRFGTGLNISKQNHFIMV